MTVVTPTPGGGTSNALTFTISAPNPVPALTSLAPTSTAAGGRLHADGEREQFRGDLPSPLERRRADDDVCQRGPGDGGDSGERHRHAGKRAGDGGESGARRGDLERLVVHHQRAPNPVPALTSLAPTSTPAGGAAFTLTVNGSNFVGTSQVRWNGAARTTTFVNAGQVTAAIPASDIVHPGERAGDGGESDQRLDDLRGGRRRVRIYRHRGGALRGQRVVFLHESDRRDRLHQQRVRRSYRRHRETLRSQDDGCLERLVVHHQRAGEPGAGTHVARPDEHGGRGGGFTLTVNGSNFVGTSQVRWNGAGADDDVGERGPGDGGDSGERHRHPGERAGDGGDADQRLDVLRGGMRRVRIYRHRGGALRGQRVVFLQESDRRDRLHQQRVRRSYLRHRETLRSQETAASNVLSFTISAAANPVPALTSLAPTSTPAGGPAFTLTVNGSNFVGTSQVRWNGVARTTTFVNAGQVTAAIPASDIVTQGSVPVTVVNPAPGGGTSNALTFTISAPANPVPALTSLAPTSTPAGGAAFTLTVNGSNFVGTSEVRWNGVARTTTFVNAGQVTAAIPASDIGHPGERAGDGGESGARRGDLERPDVHHQRARIRCRRSRRWRRRARRPGARRSR